MLHRTSNEILNHFNQYLVQLKGDVKKLKKKNKPMKRDKDKKPKISDAKKKQERKLNMRQLNFCQVNFFNYVF